MFKYFSKTQRVISFLLAVIMMFITLPMGALASVDSPNALDDYPSVSVAPEGYTEVKTIEDLYSIRNNLSGKYILMNDIDLTEATASKGAWSYGGRGWNPIGSSDNYSSTEFKGIFDGNGYSITGMRISVNDYSGYFGLFSCVGGTVKNLNMTDFDIDVSLADNNRSIHIGAIAGICSSKGTIENCHVDGNIDGYTRGGSSSSSNYPSYVGGLVGYNYGKITGCSAKGSFYSSSGVYFDKAYAGGICGFGGTVTKSYNCATVSSVNKSTSSGSSYDYVSAYATGIGVNTNATDCYNAGKISATESSSSSTSTAGGINVYASSTKPTATNCYSIGNVSSSTASKGYAIGNGTNSKCYYLAGTGTSSTGATSLTEAQALLQSMYSSFDFTNTWVIDSSALYPYPQLLKNPQNLNSLSSVILFSAPNKLEYDYKENIDLTGAKLQVSFKNQDPKFVEIKRDMISGFDSTKPGVQTITVKYYTASVTFDVFIKEKASIPIYTVDDLYNIRLDLTSNYILMNDIDLTDATAPGGDWDYSGNGWNPIGSNDNYSNLAFSGDFDGNGYSIIGMRIETTSTGAYLGLFANATGNISNLTMENVSITGGAYAGGIAASGNAATFTNCKVTGKITNVKTNAGGIIGNAKSCTVQDCQNHASVTGGACIGGIIGNASSCSVSTSYNTGKIHSKYEFGYIYSQSGSDTLGYWTTYSNYAGGIIGNASSSTVKNCYNTGKIDITTYTSSSDRVSYDANGAGISYNASATTCYNTGVAKYAIGYVSSSNNCYFLENTGYGNTGSTSLTALQMKLQSMFVGFNFTDVWAINEFANIPYPQLKSNIQDMTESAEFVSILSLPYKTEYMVGDKIDFTGAIVRVVFASGKEELVTLTEDIASGYDMTVVGEQTIHVTVSGASDYFTINVIERPTLEKIEITKQPSITSFLIGSSFDISDAQITAYYEGGITVIVPITSDMISGGNINHIGNQTLTITYDGKATTINVSVVGIMLERIEVTTKPNVTKYIEGQELDLTGMVITAIMNNGTRSTVSSGYTVSGYSSQPGQHTITVQYLNKTTSFVVTVEAKTVVSLVVNSLPIKRDYIAGEDFDPKGMQVIATYNNGTSIVVDNYTVSGFDDIPGIKNVVISFGDKQASFPVNVTARIVTDFKLVSLPSKLNYIEYEAFDTTGLKAVATYNDGKTEEITTYSIIGASSSVGTHTVSVTYGGFVRSFEITVSKRVLTNIIVTTPTKSIYEVGEDFDPTGMVVTACYNNGQQIIIDDYVLSGFDSSQEGAKEIVVSYGNLSYSFAVIIAERPSIETNGNIIVGTARARLGDTVTVPVYVTKNTGIAGFKHTINFDSSNLKMISVDTVGKYSDGTLVLNKENLENGEFTVLWFGDKNVTEDGIMYNIQFEVLESATDGSSSVSISFNDKDNGNTTGENVVFGSINGFVDIRSYWLGDLNGDRIYTMVDIVQLAQYVSGKEMTLTEKQLLSADVNEDGEINIHDVIMLNQWLLIADI